MMQEMVILLDSTNSVPGINKNHILYKAFEEVQNDILNQSRNISNYAKIFNSLGQLVLKKELNQTTKFDLNNQKNGLYYLNITTKNTRITKKLIIQN